jgi:hypothetical protein
LKIKRKQISFSPASAAVLILSVILLLITPLGAFPISSAVASMTTIPAYEITTRGSLDKAAGVEGNGYNNRYALSDINDLFSNCPAEIAIIVHGWPLDEDRAKERFDRVKMSLEHNEYIIPIVGFSWDSDTDWQTAKSIADESGPKLARFILDYMDTCKNQAVKRDINVRLIAHSLGARVILSTLHGLGMNETWNDNNFKIASVHFMGAAVDNEEVSKDYLDTGDSFYDDGLVYGEDIEGQVDNFYNLFNREDNLLEPRFTPPVYYPFFEMDLALGFNGEQLGLTEPTNYHDIDVESELANIADADGDRNCDLPNPFIPGDCTIVATGDNHLGYFGFRNASNENFRDDGAINVVVDNWRSPPP